MKETNDSAARHGLPKKILLVDDSATSLFLERMVLLDRGYQIVTARDGEDGVDTALRERPDLILMDAVMPRMGGFEALRELRRRQETLRTPVIMVTTLGEPANLEEGRAYGCRHYVTKPIDGDDLLAKVRECLDQDQGEDAAG
jgi:DNA-binding response OmpR family regulator